MTFNIDGTNSVDINTFAPLTLSNVLYNNNGIANSGGNSAFNLTSMNGTVVIASYTYTWSLFSNATDNNGYDLTPIDCSIASITSMFSFDDTVYQIEDFDTPADTETKTVSINKTQSNPIALTKNDILTLEF